MNTVIYYLGLAVIIFYIWKSKLSLKRKKVFIGFLVIVIILNLFSLITGKKILPFLFGQ
ncbi:MAG: hypothetical protein Q7K55_00155 [Candidatus Levybacteria bacterium]|nr:hypothetical protein [Candidatus Levybacteria bacterium]